MDAKFGSTILSSKPSNLYIDRDPTWKNTPREGGDGMEAQTLYSAFPSVASMNQDLNTSCTSASEVNTVNKSSCSSPLCQQREMIDRRNSPLPEKITPALKFSFNEPHMEKQRKPSEQFLIEEKSALKDHLQIQIQVNQELKRLLVASVGDELGYHYERLATEKAQLQIELDQITEKCNMKCEDVERLEISCDVWRSKFLASRMQADEASAWKRQHERYERELGSAVRGLLREHWERTEHLTELYRILSNLNTSLSWKNEKCCTVNVATNVLAENCHKLANSLSTKLTGKSNSRPPTCGVPTATPAEKYVLQLLNENNMSTTGIIHHSDIYVPACAQRRSKTTDRFHSKTLHDNITLNCCGNCQGEIQVV